MSYMDVDNMRSMIANVYDSSSWRCKVAAMGDSQVIAVYYSFLEKGKFDSRKPVRKNIEVHSKVIAKDCLGTATYGYQLSFDDLL